MHVVVAMSGGVDSSVAAWRLREAGHEVTGVFLRNGVEHAGDAHGGRSLRQGCCSVTDAGDAEEVAGRLGIRFYSLDHERGFHRIIEEFVAEYAAGRTPNPCVTCNRDLKFGELLRFATAMGADAVATGHYARLEPDGDAVVLRRGRDLAKDQSYVLAMVPREALRRSLLPLGDLSKQEVRELARQADLPVHAKAESQEICFVPTGDHRDVLRARRPELFREGPVQDQEARVLGTHGGAAGFTVGQRKGLGIGGTGPFYVTGTDPESNRVTVGRASEALRRTALLQGLNWLVDEDDLPAEGLTVQVRAHHAGCPVRVGRVPQGLALTLESPGEVIAPGQVGVVYVGDRALVGGRLALSEQPTAD